MRGGGGNLAKDGTRRGGARTGSGRKSAKMPLPILGTSPNSDETVETASEKAGQASGGGSTKRQSTRSGGTDKSQSKVDVGTKSGKSVQKTTKTTRKSAGNVVKSGKSGCKSVKDTHNDDIPDLEGADVPPVDEYLRQEQQCGKPLKADHIFEQTMNWLREIKCEHIVSRQLVEQYAMSVARWIQTEEMISQYGFLAKHPTTKAAIASPYVKMSQDYMKQVNQTWYQIYQIVRENVGDSLADSADDPMDRLLRLRGG